MAGQAETEALEKLTKKLRDAVQTAVELRIITYVGNVELRGTLNRDVNSLTVEFEAPNPAPPPEGQQGQPHTGQVILTSVNLAQGDILNVIPSNFGTEADKAILAFHSEQVKEGKEIVARNLEIIAKVGTQLLSFVKG